MAESGLYGQPMYNEGVYNAGSVSSIDNKYHIKLGGIGFILARDPFSGRHTFGRDQAPTFVNKFGSGDPTYRDASFFPHWAQINWKNGSKQDDFDDEGRFKTSANVKVYEEKKITLSNLLSTLSLSAGSVDVTCWAIDYSDSNKVFAGTSDGHVFRYASGSWTDMGDITTTGARINCLYFSKIGLNGSRSSGSGQIYAGSGTPGTSTGKLHRYDGAWAVTKTFTGHDSCLALEEFGGEMYASLGGTGVIQKASDANLATWTTSKDIDYPGYMYALKVYNNKLYAGGGSPENSPTEKYKGTLYVNDGFTWSEVFPFTHTVIKSLQVYDNLLFIGTIHAQLYVYNRATVDLLFELSQDSSNQISSMEVFKDHLYFTVSKISSNTGEEAVYLFDRAGISRIVSDTSTIRPISLLVNGSELWIGSSGTGVAYKMEASTYVAEGYLQSSYFDANLPNIPKTWFDISLETESLPASTSLEVYYKTDESDSSFTLVDTTDTDGATLSIFGFPEGLTSTKLSWKVVLKTSLNTNTPTIKKVLVRYVLQPDFRYLWKMKVACPDNVEWLDGTQPVALLTASTIVGDSTITLSDTGGFPNPGTTGERVWAVIEDDTTGTLNEFSYTGISGQTLTGCSSITAHDITTGTFHVALRGRHMHKKLLELKQRKAILSYIDIDTIRYRVLMHDYSEDGWVINTQDGLENDVSITLLEA